MIDTHRGICHICGKEDELTFEHIPPRKAFNWHRAKIYNGYEALSKSQGEPARYDNSQQGMGKYSLSIMDMFNVKYDDKCEFNLSLMYLERRNNALPLPLMFKELPKNNQES